MILWKIKRSISSLKLYLFDELPDVVRDAFRRMDHYGLLFGFDIELYIQKKFRRSALGWICEIKRYNFYTGSVENAMFALMFGSD